MTLEQYQRTTRNRFVGRRVVLLKDATNTRGERFVKGMVGVVCDKQDGLFVQFKEDGDDLVCQLHADHTFWDFVEDINVGS